jgi:hypothetical protein
MLSNQILQNSAPKFYCKTCDYSTCRKSSYDDHLLSTKHQKSTFSNHFSNQNLQKSALENFTCQFCNKEYKDKSGLWRHKKKCNNNNNNNNNDVTVTSKPSANSEDIVALKEIMKYLMKENSEMKNMMMEQQTKVIEQQNLMLEVVKNGTHNTTNNNTTHTNSHNKAFNLNFFLNETCKEAMNIGDFVDSLKMELCDLEKVGEKGYIEGITSIIVKNLKALDITKRPVHCTDKKRETIYIKDADKWEKDEDKSLMHKLIKKVVSKNMKMFPKYRETHPDCMKYHSKFGDQYQKIIYESMGGKGDNDYEKNEKIIKNVLKEVVVDKNM